ncbi:energy transducer TonB [Hydrogenobacter thermophilus]|uniref:energy transducer TonB n=1 Tax=Hydrogenobacter thermophilus TaxID=940 RepID=UPI0030FAE238
MHLRLKAYFASFIIHAAILMAIFLLLKQPLHRVVEVDLTKLDIKKEEPKEIEKPKEIRKLKEIPKAERYTKKTALMPRRETKKQVESGTVKPKKTEEEMPSKEEVPNIPEGESLNEHIETPAPVTPEERVPKAERGVQTNSTPSELTIKGQKALEEEFLKGNLEIISGIIKHNLTYPLLARKLGMEGKVIVSFLLTKDGRIKDIKVEESSGYKMLDENAINTLKRVENLMPKPPVNVRIKIPIIYRLE